MTTNLSYITGEQTE